MCDYSLHNVKSRPAKVGDKLTTHQFYSGTRRFCAPEDNNVAVCVLPGTRAFPSMTTSGAYTCGRGLRTLSATRLQSSGRSTNAILCIITEFGGASRFLSFLFRSVPSCLVLRI